MRRRVKALLGWSVRPVVSATRTDRLTDGRTGILLIFGCCLRRARRRRCFIYMRRSHSWAAAGARQASPPSRRFDSCRGGAIHS